LTDGTSLIERPRVSPDGTAIVFNVGHEPVTNLYTMPITGGAPKQLTFRDSLNVGGVWSADGTRIAFASTEGGKPGVWSVDAGGGVPRALSSGDLSDSLDLAWSSGAHILYQQAGNRNYYVLDPETRQERLLANNGSPGWMFSPVYSPDGWKVAVQWNRPPNRGLWVIDTRNNQETLLSRTSARSVLPVAWSANGRSLYVLEGKPSTYRGPTLPLGETVTDAKILMVSVNGGRVKTLASLPFEEIGGVSMTPDGRRFVFTVYTSRSDVWVVDNFDVAREPRIPRTRGSERRHQR
jgi:Tol biopolymer transport system component